MPNTTTTNKISHYFFSVIYIFFSFDILCVSIFFINFFFYYIITFKHTYIWYRLNIAFSFCHITQINGSVTKECHLIQANRFIFCLQVFSCASAFFISSFVCFCVCKFLYTSAFNIILTTIIILYNRNNNNNNKFFSFIYFFFIQDFFFLFLINIICIASLKDKVAVVLTNICMYNVYNNHVIYIPSKQAQTYRYSFVVFIHMFCSMFLLKDILKIIQKKTL